MILGHCSPRLNGRRLMSHFVSSMRNIWIGRKAACVCEVQKEQRFQHICAGAYNYVTQKIFIQLNLNIKCIRASEVLTVGTAQVADAVDLYVRVHNCVEQAGPGCVTNEHSQSSSSILEMLQACGVILSLSKDGPRKDYKQCIYHIITYVICVWLNFIKTWTPCWPPAEWGNDVWWTGGFSLKWAICMILFLERITTA